MLRICREDGAILFVLLSFGAWDFQYKFSATVDRLTVDGKTTQFDFIISSSPVANESVREESEHARGEEKAQL